MIVFKYFFDMKDVFGRKMDEMAPTDNLEQEEVSLAIYLSLFFTVRIYIYNATATNENLSFSYP